MFHQLLKLQIILKHSAKVTTEQCFCTTAELEILIRENKYRVI